MGSFWTYVGIDNLVESTSGHHAKYVVEIIVGAFVVGANSQPFLQWFKRQWESEDV